MKTLLGTIFLALIFMQACTDDDSVYSSSSSSSSNDASDSIYNENFYWSIPTNEVFDGGPGKDGIPALENPRLINILDATYLKDDDLVLGLVSGNSIIAYPHKILDWHEIINDSTGSLNVAITYCPLTGTGIGWNREISGEITTIGVSGLLYNSNLIPYDRGSDSNWSQMRLECVYGKLAGTSAQIINIFETNLKTWIEMYPSSKVVSTRTGYTRTYDTYPYGNYKTNEHIIFPVDPLDERLHLKERVHGVILNSKAKVYRFSSFPNDFVLIKDNFQFQKLLIIGNQNKNFIVSFINNLDEFHSFEVVQNELPIILSDNEGNKWNIWGEAVTGPRKGQKLIQTVSFMGYWFAWGAFYPNADIY